MHFKNLNVDIIYIINLAHHKKRREYVEAEIRNRIYDANIQFIDGVYGNELTDIKTLIKDGILNTEFWDAEGAFNKNIIGCALSHKKVYDTFLASDYNTCLILEDDVKFSESFYIDVITGNFIEFINSLRSTEYDLCFWGKSSSAIINNKQITPFLYETKLCTYTWAAHAYQITRKCAEKLVANYFPVKYAADVFLETSDIKIVSPSYSYFLQHIGPIPTEEYYNLMVLLGTSPLHDKRKDWSEYVSLTNTWDTDNREETDNTTDQFHRHIRRCTLQDNIPVKMVTYEDKKHPNGMTTRNWATIHFDTN